MSCYYYLFRSSGFFSSMLGMLSAGQKGFGGTSPHHFQVPCEPVFCFPPWSGEWASPRLPSYNDEEG